jgi:Ca-activated chloride channel homolog
MHVGLQYALSDANLPLQAAVNQRQLVVSLRAISEMTQPGIPLNLCLVLDHSHSMRGRSIEMVKHAAQQLVSQLAPGDRISIIGFDHQASVLIPNQAVYTPTKLLTEISQLQAEGGTALDEGMALGITELIKGRKGAVSQLILLTDGENEHGSNERCLKLAQQAVNYNLTLNTIGLGEYWNREVLEQIADIGGGTLSYIQHPDDVTAVFNGVLERARLVGVTDSYLMLSLMPQVHLATHKPVAQVAPETVELPVYPEGEWLKIRLGDLMTELDRVVLVNLYIRQLAAGQQPIVHMRVRYDVPGSGEKTYSDIYTVKALVHSDYQPTIEPMVHRYMLTLAKYRQTQVAEHKLQRGDLPGAAAMMKTAATTALNLGDQQGASVLQAQAAHLKQGQYPTDIAYKQVLMASKTILM